MGSEKRKEMELEKKRKEKKGYSRFVIGIYHRLGQGNYTTSFMTWREREFLLAEEPKSNSQTTIETTENNSIIFNVFFFSFIFQDTSGDEKSSLPVDGSSGDSSPDSFLSLLIPAPLRETLWTTVALYVGWRLVSHLR